MKSRKIFLTGLRFFAVFSVFLAGCTQDLNDQAADQDGYINAPGDSDEVGGADTTFGGAGSGDDTAFDGVNAGGDTANSGGDTANPGGDTAGGGANPKDTGDGKDDPDSDSVFGAGTGVAGDPLAPGIKPNTADDCGSGTPVGAGSSKVIKVTTDCYWGGGKVFVPAAVMEQIVESVNNVKWVHIRLTFDPRFVDNSYGTNAIGWGAGLPWDDKKKSGHTFKDLVGSDHAEMILKDKLGRVVMQFKLDYISQDPSAPSGYGTLGVSDRDGKMIVGQENWILGASTSLHRNLNGCGYSKYTVNSPRTDMNYTPNPKAPEWDFRVVYEVWVKAAPFMPAGFGNAAIDYVHASPSKTGNNTIEVTRRKCPEGDGGKFKYWGDEDEDDGDDSGGGGGGTDGSGGGTDGGNNSDDTGDDCSDCTMSDTDEDDIPPV